ncbi:hypothetical protein MKZ38_001341 [Zalerion maritima]|uniref:Uncharacterized protein n=1 Tax=Zalerion maritima TaxID=339359 RepID=A0AAD5WMZ1_9PEZI|nr:hypothetical protein MKZ38_001341 [Zalerion maritima]
MHFSLSQSLATVVVGATVSNATPYHPPKGLTSRAPPAMARRVHNPLHKRFSDEVDLSVFSLVDQVLFDGNTGLSALVPVVGANDGGNIVNLTCNECLLDGQVTFTFLEEVQEFFDETIILPIDPVGDAANLIQALDEVGRATARVELKGFKAHFDLGLSMASGDSFAFTLISVPIIGVVLPPTGTTKIIEAGLIAAIDLVFSADTEIDIEGGFEVSIPDGAFFELGINNGEIIDTDFFDGGIIANEIPVSVNTGTSGVFKVSLRLRVQVGVTAGLPAPLPGAVDVGAVAYANIIELVGTFNKTEACDLEASVIFDINVGAGLKANLDLGFEKFNVPAPEVQTTLFTLDILGPTCLVGNGTAAPTSLLTLTGTTASETPIMASTDNYTTETWTKTTDTTVTVTECLPSPTKTTIFVTATGYKMNQTGETTSSEAVSTVLSMSKCLVSIAPGGNCPIDQVTGVVPGEATTTATASVSANMTEEAYASEYATDVVTSFTETPAATTAAADIPGPVLGDDGIVNGTLSEPSTATETPIQVAGAADIRARGSAMALFSALVGVVVFL